MLARLPFAVCIVDAGLRVRWANLTFLRFVDESHRREVVGQGLEYLLEDPVRPLVELAREAFAAGEPRVAGEWEQQASDSSSTWRWFLLPVEFPPQPGPVTALLLVAVDITDQVLMRRESEELAREAQQRAVELDAVLKALTDGVVIYDALGRPVYVNPAALRALGFDPFTVNRDADGERLSVYLPDGRVPPVEELPSRRALAGETVEVLGAFDDAVFPEARASLGTGDLVLLYTDGLTEARDSTGFFGEQGLEAFLAAKPRLAAADLPGTLLETVTSFAGGRLADDVALFALALKSRRRSRTLRPESGDAEMVSTAGSPAS